MRIDSAPASLAATGGAPRSQSARLLEVMNWNTSMLTPASPMHKNFRRKSAFAKYPSGRLKIKIAPHIEATKNPPQVHGNSSRAISEYGRRVEASPRRRRSMMAMVPNTIEMAKMCTTSSAGNAQVDSAIHNDTGDSPSE